jgi:hypothetical protein
LLLNRASFDFDNMQEYTAERLLGALDVLLE